MVWTCDIGWAGNRYSLFLSGTIYAYTCLKSRSMTYQHSPPCWDVAGTRSKNTHNERNQQCSHRGPDSRHCSHPYTRSDLDIAWNIIMHAVTSKTKKVLSTVNQLLIMCKKFFRGLRDILWREHFSPRTSPPMSRILRCQLFSSSSWKLVAINQFFTC